MAARTRRTTLSDNWKEKIRASHLINRLVAFVDGEIELTNQQVKAIEILLKKVAPDLARVDNTHDGSISLNVITGVPSEHDATDLV